SGIGSANNFGFPGNGGHPCYSAQSLLEARPEIEAAKTLSNPPIFVYIDGTFVHPRGEVWRQSAKVDCCGSISLDDKFGAKSSGAALCIVVSAQSTQRLDCRHGS